MKVKKIKQTAKFKKGDFIKFYVELDLGYGIICDKLEIEGVYYYSVFFLKASIASNDIQFFPGSLVDQTSELYDFEVKQKSLTLDE